MKTKCLSDCNCDGKNIGEMDHWGTSIFILNTVKPGTKWLIFCRQQYFQVEIVKMEWYFLFKFQGSLFLRVQLIKHLWFRQLLGAEKAKNTLKPVTCTTDGLFDWLACIPNDKIYIDGLVQDCSISSALALEILQSCTKALICCSLALSHHYALFSQWDHQYCINMCDQQVIIAGAFVCV